MRKIEIFDPETFIIRRTKKQELANRNSLDSNSLTSEFEGLHTSKLLNNHLPGISAVNCIEQKVQTSQVKKKIKQ